MSPDITECLFHNAYINIAFWFHGFDGGNTNDRAVANGAASITDIDSIRLIAVLLSLSVSNRRCCAVLVITLASIYYKGVKEIWQIATLASKCLQDRIDWGIHTERVSHVTAHDRH